MTERPHGAPLPDVTRHELLKQQERMYADLMAWWDAYFDEGWADEDEQRAQWLISRGWRRP